MKKAQASTEYLALLGGALIITLFLVYLFSQDISRGQSTLIENNRAYWRINKPIALTYSSYVDYYDSNQTYKIKVVLKNSGIRSLWVYNLTFEDYGTKTLYVNGDSTNKKTLLNPGGSVTLYNVFTNNRSKIEEGNTYEISNIKIYYAYAGGNENGTFQVVGNSIYMIVGTGRNLSYNSMTTTE